MLSKKLGAPLVAAMLLTAGVFVTGQTAGCTKQATPASPSNAANGNESPGAAEADMKTVILNVFGMT